MGRPVLITGASSGIGYELAKVCAAKQHDLILIARREERLKHLKVELEAAHGVQVWTYQGDLTDALTRQQFFDWTQELGVPLYALVNNAGFGDLRALINSDWGKLDAMLQLNIVALTHLTRLLLPGMVEQGQGRLLNLASTAAFLPGPYMAVYYASKAYVLSFTSGIASELEGTGVTATTLCPGPTASEFQERADMEDVKFLQDRSLPTSAEVAAYGYEVMMAGEEVAVHGLGNKIMALSTRLLPRKQLAKAAKNLQKPA